MTSWHAPDEAISSFLDEFQRQSEQPDGTVGDQFDETFMVADPVRAVAISRDAFVNSLSLRRKFFTDAGIGSPTLVDAEQLDLDERHYLVKTTWRASRSGADDVLLESSFLLRDRPPMQIIAYLNHKDVATLLGRH